MYKNKYALKNIISFLCLLSISLASVAGLDLAKEPLAIKTAGAPPNIMLLFDDSRSMTCTSRGCGDDIDYSPGYDSEKRYECTGVNILAAQAAKTVVVKISLTSSYEGTPYFEYDGTDYGWGTLSGAVTNTTPEIYGNLNAQRVCFDPDADYLVKKQSMDVSAGITFHYLYSDEDEEVLSGNYLNWYFSATLAEWADASADGGYKDYGEVFPNHSHWTQEVARDFIYLNTWYQGGDPASTVINGSTSNDNGKTWFPDDPPPDYPSTNRGWTYHESNGHQDDQHNLLGLKPGVYAFQSRLMVAKDVAKFLIRKLDHARLGVSAMFTPVATDFSVPDRSGMDALDHGDGGTLVHGLVEVNNASEDVAEITASDAMKTSLAQAIDAINSALGTPTAEAMAATASYMFQTYGSYESPIGSTGQTIAGSLPSSLIKHTAAPEVDTSVANVTEAEWCAKNVMVVLTDGKPIRDTNYPEDFRTYYPQGLPDPSTPAVDDWGNERRNASGIVRVAGGLYDFDWLPHIQGTQNIETFFIAMGSDTITEDPIFDLAGKAGGGGINNSYAANNGAEIVAAFNSIIEKVNASSASVTAVAVSSVSELQADNYAVQATYDTEFWTSKLKALKVNADGAFVNPDGSGAASTSLNIEPVWEAATILSQMLLINDDDLNGENLSLNNLTSRFLSRTIFTWSGTQGIPFGGASMTRPGTSSTSFSEFSSLNAAMQADLKALAGNDYQEVYDLMAYLMGDATHEEGFPVVGGDEKYRQRGIFLDVDDDGLIDGVHSGGLFGDIVHSSPVYVGAPSRPWGDDHFGTVGKPYSAFVQAQEDRKPMVYAGANDGFLHAVSVEAGTKSGEDFPAGGELFAYMPLSLASAASDAGYHYLANPDYEHRYYVDLTATPSDVFVDFYNSGSGSEKLDAEWRTILVGGLRGGGKGYFALDVTCPYVTASGTNTCDDESFSAENVLWEFSEANDVDMGYTFGDPVIVKVNYDSGYTYGVNGDERNGNGHGRWAVIVPNGYNASTGRAALYILFVDGGLDGVWTEGVDYIKLQVSTDVADNPSNPNGLSSATAIDIDSDGIIDRVYAGDLKGQLWSFDLQSEASLTQYLNDTLAWSSNKLFTTGKDSATPQPITSAPMVARDGSVKAAEPNLMVVFGTGQYLQESDLTDSSLQSIYGVHDRGQYNLTRYNVVSSGLPALEPRLFTEVTFTVSGETIINRKIAGDPVLWGVQYGWYADLASDLDDDGVISGSEILGERQVFRPFIANSLFVFNTIIPVVSSCSGATEGWTMLIDWTSGLPPAFNSYDANLSGDIDALDVGYVGYFNEAAGSELGRGGDNIYDSIGETARQQSVDFGSVEGGQRLGWEEKVFFAP